MNSYLDALFSLAGRRADRRQLRHRRGHRAALAARTHVGRNGMPEDFAGLAVFLSSEASGFVTGQAIAVDGGFSVS